jgi:DNA primase
MRFPPSFLDEIRARLPVSDVVGRRVKLKKAGREWRGLSPFNKERTPSFFANDQKGMWFDFSSGKNGNIFDFLMATEGVSFPEAVERLAGMAGLPLPAVSSELEALEQRRKSLYEIMEIAAKFFETTLAGRSGAKARGYLADRGLQPSTQLEFRLGYAPAERFALKEHLGSQGITVEDMIEAGLLVAGEDIPIPYDRFRDRIIIPIHDQRGRVVAFGGRTLSPDVQPKYLNSPETSLFHKGSIVFNFHRARQPAHDDGSVVVVEGYMDAISIYQAGMRSVVATMGTAFTEQQIETLWRLSAEPIVCFDADRAGVAAAHRSIDRILPVLKVGRTFRFAFLVAGKDPDELIRERGLDAFVNVLSGSQPLWDVLWEREIANTKVDSPDARAALEHRLYSIIRTIKDPIVQTSYHRTCRVDLSDLFWSIARSRRDTPEKGFTKTQLHIQKEGSRHDIQKLLLGVLVHYPEFIDDKSDQIASVRFADELEEFRRALYDLLILHGEVSVELIYKQLGPGFYKILEDIHGDKSGDRQRGYRLFQRFPLLAFDPGPDFLSRCIDHFVHILQVEQMDEDRRRIKAELSAKMSESDYETKSNQLILLVREILLQSEVINNQDTTLAEEAQEIRRLGRPAAWSTPLFERGFAMA